MKNNTHNDLWEKLFNYREKVRNYLRNYYYGLYDADFENIFQDAIMLICEKTQKGELEIEDVSLSSTYITRVCIYKTQELLRKKNKDTKFTYTINKEYLISRESSFVNEKIDNLIALSPEKKYMEEEKENLIRKMVLNLPSPCNEILIGFYWDRMSIKELAEKYHKGSENAAKVTKHRCCEKFRNKYLSQIKAQGWQN